VSVESNNFFAPSKLLSHVRPEVNIISGPREKAMGLNKSISSSLEAWMHICPFYRIVIEGGRYSA